MCSAQQLYKLEARTLNELQENEIPTLPNASHLSVTPRPRFAYEQQTAGRLETGLNSSQKL